eukprot:GHVT01046600.1.p1 GENE.GHVT01046600.1~~GHVT01046600.1.p1  ORF type:complete len:102 (+),score=7.77 GHVT01046600.1:233-538(+)
MAELVKFHRGANLLYKNYLHKKDRVYAGKQHWRCIVAGCPGRVHTDQHHLTLVLHDKDHNHMADDEMVASRKMKATLCARAKEGNSRSLGQTIDNGVVPPW